MTTCPTCGHRSRETKKTTVPVDVATMTDTDLFAHYKRTAPQEDLKFFLKLTTLSPVVRANAESLIGSTLSRTEFYRQFTYLQDVWRRETNAADRAERMAVVDERMAA